MLLIYDIILGGHCWHVFMDTTIDVSEGELLVYSVYAAQPLTKCECCRSGKLFLHFSKMIWQRNKKYT